MADKFVKGYVQQKHDTAAHWNSSSLVPAAGQIIVYDDGAGGESMPRIKVGDGATSVKNLAFISVPKVTTTDNGKFLRVVEGQWTASTVPNAESNVF